MNFQERSVVLGFKIAWATFGYLPDSLLQLIARFASKRTFKKQGAGVRRLVFNIARVLNLDINDSKVIEVSKSALNSYMRYWVSMFALPKRSNAYLESAVVMRNEDELANALKAGTGVILAVTHSGNWDLAGAYVADKFGGITTVAERLRPVELFDEFTRHRLKRKIEIIAHRGGKVPPSVALANALQSGKLTGLVTDRDMSHHGIEVNFFGHIAKMPLGAAKLAIENNALIIPAAVFEENGKTIIDFSPSLDLSTQNPEIVTQNLAHIFEDIISKHPENWHMLQKIWVDMPRNLEDPK